MADRPIERRSSRTAAFTCVTRAYLNRQRDPLLHGPDTVAWVFLPFLAKLAISVPPIARLFIRRFVPPGVPEYVLGRTKVFDAALSDALDKGMSQVVVLGAGFDTRALRFHDRNHSPRVFELDIASTQTAKLGVFKRKNIALPDELTFVPIDFDTQDLGSTLRAAGYRDGERTLFLWEGVTMYLTADAVHRTLDFVAGSAARGSVLVFDYVFASVLRGESHVYGDQQIAMTVARAGEAWTFGLEEDEAAAFLSAHGFDLRASCNPTDLERMFFSAADGTVLRRVNGAHCIVSTVVR